MLVMFAGTKRQDLKTFVTAPVAGPVSQSENYTQTPARFTSSGHQGQAGAIRLSFYPLNLPGACPVVKDITISSEVCV
jgi:hypothetical protein